MNWSNKHILWLKDYNGVEDMESRKLIPVYDCVYECGENSFVFSMENSVLMKSFEDFTSINVNTTTTQAISQIGGNISSQVIGSRNLSLSGVIYQNVDTIKQRLIDTFIPFVEGVLTINKKFKINCFTTSTPSIEIKRDLPNFVISLTCPFPLFRSSENKVFYLNYQEGMFKFPWNMAKYQFGQRAIKYNFGLQNDGHFSSPYIIEFYALGEVVNPKLIMRKSNNDIDSLTFNKALANGDRVVISSDNTGVTAIFENNEGKKDMTGLIDFDSDLLEIPRGYSAVQISAERGGESLQCKIEYPLLYGGVIV